MDFVQTLKTRKLSLDDIYDAVYKKEKNAQIANDTRTDILGQMKNVRDIPTSASGVNSPRADKSDSDKIFDDMVGTGLDMNDLFG